MKAVEKINLVKNICSQLDKDLDSQEDKLFVLSHNGVGFEYDYEHDYNGNITYQS